MPNNFLQKIHYLNINFLFTRAKNLNSFKTRPIVMIVHGRHNEMMRKQEPNNSIMKWRHKLCVCEKKITEQQYAMMICQSLAISFLKEENVLIFFYSPDLQILFNGRHQQLDNPVDLYVSKSVQKIKESSNSRRVHAYF